MLSGILWSAACRGEVVLAEAGEDNYDGAVIKLAQKLLKKKATAGWEFEKARKDKLKGIKFHVFDSCGEGILVWSFCAVAEQSLEDAQLRSFMEKLVYISEPLRDSAEWRKGEALSAQASFAPILLQKMEQVMTQGKMAMVNEKVDSTKQIMAANIELALQREETLEEMQQKSEDLNGMAKQFKKKAKQVKRFKMMQNAKHGVIIGTAVTAVTAAVVVPPLVALL